MSLKQWAAAPRPKTEDVEEFWAKAGGRPQTAASLASAGTLYIEEEEQETTFRRYMTPSGRLDGSVWWAWRVCVGRKERQRDQKADRSTEHTVR